MTMIVSAHLGDCLLIAADKRAMVCDIETGDMRLFHDDEAKIKLWSLGAIAGTGETIFLNRIMDYFLSFKVEEDKELKQMDVIYEEIEKRLLEGVTKEMLINNTLIFSMFDGEQSHLYCLPVEPFFKERDRGDGVKVIRPYLHEVHPWVVDVTCFNLPPDISSLQNFQRNLRSLSSFGTEIAFLEYHIQQLKQVFAIQASIDPSITTSFDLYLQVCETGHSLVLHIENPVLSSPPSKELNYWSKNKT
ncbi:hypothetical protein DCO44_14750 [Acinetobacter sp. AM]|uniref:hypothetical protein n=1 Tax=Acinetobacter sp. AM TaxID=2170730 RepID=UPI000DE6A5C4|nr:hypothetical protein [Acinetobacter sp. AM]PWB13331.1 hypothetical protein DCO44_14750 [Acinetobacter sp. AM]